MIFESFGSFSDSHFKVISLKMIHSCRCQFLNKLISGFTMVYCTQAESLYLLIWDKLLFVLVGG